MSEELTGNCLITQMGPATAVTNASLAGAIEEALNHPCIEEIYGARDGISGLLQEDLVDLAEESQQVIRGLRTTPAAALGTSSQRLKRPEELERALEVFAAHDIRYLVLIGSAEAQETAQQIHDLAVERGYSLRVIGIPQAVDNTLHGTDHCPGFGSAMKHLCLLAEEMACTGRSGGRHDTVLILEVAGRAAGWLAAGTSLLKRKDHPDDPPHLILLPEQPFQPEKFLADLQRVLQKERFALVVVAEGLADEDGNYLSTSGNAVDAYGQVQLGGVGEYLCGLIEEQFALRTQSVRPGGLQAAAAHAASGADADEAFLAGRAAIGAAVDGASGQMVTLLRAEKEQYECLTGLIALREAVDGVKRLPAEWINENGISMNQQFLKYAQPLVEGESFPSFANGLPEYVRLRGRRVERRLEPFATL